MMRWKGFMRMMNITHTLGDHTVSSPLQKRIQEMKLEGKPEPGLSLSSTMMTKQRIPSVDHVILISSAKGGVGKSTVATNLAISLSQKGKRVGLLDADVYGPSIPKMMGLEGPVEVSSQGLLIPKQNYGLECMSMGFLVGPTAPIVWRGFMVMKALRQLLFQVAWSPLDVLVVDMPPGTGDTQLTICQSTIISGAVIVSTPQSVALDDTRKGILMFQLLEIPILGLVQNMGVFECPCCKTRHHLFGEDGVVRLANDMSIPFLGDIPLEPSLCQASEKGLPILVTDRSTRASQSYLELSSRVLAMLWK